MSTSTRRYYDFGRRQPRVQNSVVVSGPPPGPQPILSYENFDSFTRTTEASYVENGVLKYALPNVIRKHDPGSGPIYWFEGPATNQATNSENPGAEFTNANCTSAIDGDSAPDNIGTGNRITAITAAAAGLTKTVPTGDGTLSFYYKSGAKNTGSHNHSASARSVSPADQTSFAPSSTWERVNNIQDSSISGMTCGIYINDDLATGSAPAGDDLQLYAVQYEQTIYMTSYIRNTTGSALGRDGDIAYFNSAPGLFTQKWAIDVVPALSSEDVRQIRGQWNIFQAGTALQNAFYMRDQFGGSCRFRITEGNASLINTGPIVFDAYQKLTLTVDPINGTLEVSGATSGDGTYTGPGFVWSPTQVNVGSGITAGTPGNRPWYGGISEPFAVT